MASAHDGEWLHALETPLPRALRVGGGSALFVSGWVFHRRSPLEAVTLRFGGAEYPVRIHSMPRLDVYVALAGPDDEPATAAYRCGFWTVVPSGEMAKSSMYRVPPTAGSTVASSALAIA